MVAAIEIRGQNRACPGTFRLLQQEGEPSEERANVRRRLAQLQKGLDFEQEAPDPDGTGVRTEGLALGSRGGDEAFLAETAAEEEHIEQLKGLIVGVLSEMAECRNRISDAAARLSQVSAVRQDSKAARTHSLSAMQKTRRPDRGDR